MDPDEEGQYRKTSCQHKGECSDCQTETKHVLKMDSNPTTKKSPLKSILRESSKRKSQGKPDNRNSPGCNDSEELIRCTREPILTASDSEAIRLDPAKVVRFASEVEYIPPGEWNFYRRCNRVRDSGRRKRKHKHK